MALPFEPQTEAQIVARFHLAMTPEYEVLEVAKHPGSEPSKLRQHVFDFEDGIRMIASIDYGQGTRWLHLSFSLWTSFVPIWQRDAYTRRVLSLCEKFAHARKTMRVGLKMNTPAGVDHFLFPLKPHP